MIRILLPLLFLALGLFVSSPDATAQEESVPAVTAVIEEEDEPETPAATPTSTEQPSAPATEAAQAAPAPAPETPAAQTHPESSGTEMPGTDEAAADQEVTIVK